MSDTETADRYPISPAMLRGAASDAVPEDIAQALDVTDNLSLFRKLDHLRVQSGRRHLAQADLPTNRSRVGSLHRLAREEIRNLAKP